MNRIVMVAACLFLAGCEEAKYPKYAVDQKERQQLFKECLAALPEGPRSTTYNDWDEVVNACENSAYYQAQYCYENCPPLRTVPKPSGGK